MNWSVLDVIHVHLVTLLETYYESASGEDPDGTWSIVFDDETRFVRRAKDARLELGIGYIEVAAESLRRALRISQSADMAPSTRDTADSSAINELLLLVARASKWTTMADTLLDESAKCAKCVRITEAQKKAGGDSRILTDAQAESAVKMFRELELDGLKANAAQMRIAKFFFEKGISGRDGKPMSTSTVRREILKFLDQQ